MLEISFIEILKPDDFQPEFEPAFTMERVWLIYSLEDNAEYAAHEIAKLGYPEKCQEYQRTRKAFSRLGTRNDLSNNYDNRDKRPGEHKRWAGSSWKDVLGVGYQSRMYLLMDELKKRLDEDPGPYFLDKNQLLHARDIKQPKQAKRRVRKTRRPLARHGSEKVDPLENSTTNKFLLVIKDKSIEHQQETQRHAFPARTYRIHFPTDNSGHASVKVSGRRKWKVFAVAIVIIASIVYAVAHTKPTGPPPIIYQSAPPD